MIKSVAPRLSVLVLLLAIACGGSDEPAIETQVPGWTVRASEFSFDYGGPALPGGTVDVTLDNTGSEQHELRLFKIDDGKTEDDLYAAIQGGTTPDFATLTGNIDAIAAGKSSTKRLTLEPGSYGLACFLATDGKSHYASGMRGALKLNPQ